MARTYQAKSFKWQLSDTPIGSGDAGEVFSAVCVDEPGIQAVVKKPARVATGGTIQRQAGQILQEAQALVRLDGLPDGKAHPPRLLDEAPDFTRGTADYFIVSETAPGEALDTMLTKTRQTGKPFPRRVIITVLDALFDLFSRAHQAGVLWNDVKLDHIYWHNPSGSVSVIDWGNALFIDQPDSDAQPTPPRWEDYHQFIDSLGAFIERSAPELYLDLGWEEFTGITLDLPTISILARRIAYQQEVVSLRVMEYQALIRVVLSADPDIKGLEEILEYQAILDKIGAPWPRQDVLAYGSSLVQKLSDGKAVNGSLRATATLFELFGESLQLPWHLLREVFRQPDLIGHHGLPALIKQTLNENWEEALWQLVTIAHETGQAPWWQQLIPVVRQKAIGLVTPPPYDICQRLHEGSKSSNKPTHKSFSTFTRDAWRRKGEESQDSLFDYSLLDALAEDKSLPSSFRLQLKESYAAGKEAIRELLRAWVNLNWEELDEKLKQVLAWDPDRWMLLALANGLKDFHLWVTRLYEGPGPGTPASAFLQSMQEAQPRINKVLGQPPWFRALNDMLSTLIEKNRHHPPRSLLEQWCPWVINDPEVWHPDEGSTTDEADISIQLSHFVGHLKSWSDIDAGLESVRETAPAFLTTCKNLAEGFTEALSLNFKPAPFTTLCDTPQHPALAEACQALKALFIWRRSLSEESLADAESQICDPSLDAWTLINHACKTSRYWLDTVSTFLQLFLEDEHTAYESLPEQAQLSRVLSGLDELRSHWPKVYRFGFQLPWIETLEEIIEDSQKQFLTWRKEIEHTNDRIERILYHSQLDHIQKTSSKLLTLSQQTRLARLAFSELELNEGNTNSVRRLDVLARMLNHLLVIESKITSNTSVQKVPDWQKLVYQLRDTPTTEEQRMVVRSLSGNHPLYTWLVDVII